MRRGLIIGMAVACALLAPGSARGQDFEPGHVNTCFEYVPAALSVKTEPLIDVYLHVVLDEGVTLEDGRRMVERAQGVYAKVGLRLRPNFTTARMTSDDARELFQELKGLFGGERPPWAHVVYLLTKRDISDGGNSVAGVADCIGGAAFPESAFAIGEAVDDDRQELGPVSLWAERPARVAAHEVAHLFGAHHHFSECATAVPATATTAPAPCTLMFPELSMIGLSFSALEGSTVRGHAESYLLPVTAPAPPDGTRSVPPDPKGCVLVTHRDVRSDHAFVTANNPVDVDLLRGTFFHAGDGVVRFRWDVAELTGTHPAQLRYWLDLPNPGDLRIEVALDGTTPTARAISGSDVVAEGLRATVVTGKDGFVEVEIPLEAVGIEGEVPVGRMAALTPDEWVDYDTSLPYLRRIQPGPCTEPAVDGASGAGTLPSGGSAPGEGTPKPAGVSVDLIDRSARRGRLRVRVTGDLRGVRVRLADRRGRRVAVGRAARVAGSKVIALRTLRRPRAGVHVLSLSARDAAGRTVTQRLRVKLRR